jgi:hypothetical protein
MTVRRVRGFSPITGAVAGLVVWAVHFGVVYGANAVACERELTGRTLLGQPLVPALVLGATALALAALALVWLRAWRRMEHGLAGQEGEDASRFLEWFTAATALLSAVAILWEGLPVLFVQPCG